jgi:DNA repair exonuclease SbcCD ATPase subunit
VAASRFTFSFWVGHSFRGGKSGSRAEALKQREAELLTEQRFLGELVAKGAGIFRHNENGRWDINEETLSARRIVSHLLAESDVSTPPPLRLQREIIDQGKTLGETAAGIAIAGDLYKARKEHEKQLRDLELELKGRLAKANASHAAELEDLKADIQKKLSKAEEEKEALRKSMVDVHEQEEKVWKEKIQLLDKRFREEIAQKEEELEELEEAICEIHEEAMSSKWSPQAEKEYEEHESILNTARQEAGQAKDAHEKLKAQTGNITNGLVNGLAAGLAMAIATGGMFSSSCKIGVERPMVATL